jgi:hypothetical protein
MRNATRCCAARGLVLATLALSAMLALQSAPAAARCGGGPLSGSPGNVIGSVAGGVAGGLIGSQIGHGSGKSVATGLGVVGGALVGGSVGRSVECSSGPRGGTRAGRNSAAGSADAQTCRFVRTQAEIDGNQQPVDGIACLDAADGSWKTASGPTAEHAAETDLILRAQQQLQQLGFYVRGNPDGRWGPVTRSAVGDFQRANKLAATGELDDATRNALGLEPAPLETGTAAPSGQPGETGTPQ